MGLQITPTGGSVTSQAVADAIQSGPAKEQLNAAIESGIGSNIAEQGIQSHESSIAAPYAGSPQPATNVTEQTTGSTDPVLIGAWGGKVYGFNGFTLYSSDDNGRTWTMIQTVPGSPPSHIADIRSVDDGEVLLGRGDQGLWKSSGWATDPTTATWTQVVETTQVPDDGIHGATSGDINPWGLSVWGQYVCVTEYGGESSYRPMSRMTWLSTDYGSTFHPIYDLNTDPDGVTGLTSHMHATEIDRWQSDTNGNPRLWISHHDYDAGTGSGGQRVRYSDNAVAVIKAGGDLSQIVWTTFWRDVPAAQPTVIVATPASILFGSDGNPEGVHRARRIDNKGNLSLPELAWAWRSEASLSIICRQAIRISDGFLLMCFRGDNNGVPGFVVMTDGLRAVEVYRTDVDPTGQPMMTYATVVNGEMVARQFMSGTGGYDKLIRATAPFFGAPPSGGASALDDLTDVNLAGLQAGQVLGTTDGTEWTPVDVAGGLSALAVSEGAGNYVSTPRVAESDASGALGRLHYTPLWIDRTLTIDSLSVLVQTAGAAGAAIRLGIYDTDPVQAHPGSLIVEAGTVDTTTTGTKTVAIAAPVTLRPGLYWLAAVMQTAQSTVRAVSTVPYVLSADTINTTMYTSRMEASVTGALPVTAATGAGTNRYSTLPPVVWAHVSAVA